MDERDAKGEKEGRWNKENWIFKKNKNMEISVESIISILGLLSGGGVVGGLLTLKYARKKAEAEAKQADAEAKRMEAEAKKAEEQARQEQQNYYQKIVDDIAKDRDYYKQERNELRDNLDVLKRSVAEWKRISEDERIKMKKDINTLRLQLSCMRPFLCSRENCALRVAIGDADVYVGKAEPKDIDPLPVGIDQ